MMYESKKNDVKKDDRKKNNDVIVLTKRMMMKKKENRSNVSTDFLKWIVKEEKTQQIVRLLMIRKS